MTQFAAKEKDAHPDVVLFYFAGHGFALNDDLGARNYLMATSAHLNAKSEALLRHEGFALNDAVSRIAKGARVVLVFIDACRNDPFHRGAANRGFVRDEMRGVEQVYIGMSTTLGRPAEDGEPGQGSPFAKAFAAAIVQPGLRIDDAFRALREQVLKETGGKQEPEILQDKLAQGSITLVERK